MSDGGPGISPDEGGKERALGVSGEAVEIVAPRARRTFTPGAGDGHGRAGQVAEEADGMA